VAWVGVEGRAAATQGEDRDFSAAPPDAALAQIESRARAALAPILDRAGEDRPYHAHVTVARPRQPWRRDAVSAFRSACEGLAGEWEGTRAVLMESRLGSEARYTVRRQYPLAEEVAA
jgi:2'-5' RNA ligase